MILHCASIVVLTVLFAAYLARGIWIETFRGKRKQRWRAREKEVFYFNDGAKTMFISTAQSYNPSKNTRLGINLLLAERFGSA